MIYVPVGVVKNIKNVVYIKEYSNLLIMKN